jgi:hypothetical protein
MPKNSASLAERKIRCHFITIRKIKKAIDKNIACHYWRRIVVVKVLHDINSVVCVCLDFHAIAPVIVSAIIHAHTASMDTASVMSRILILYPPLMLF